MKRVITLLFIFSPLLLVGCKDITDIQRHYVADRDACVTKSKTDTGVYFDTYPDSANSKARQNVQSEPFCECMHEHGWETTRSIFEPHPECPKASSGKETK